MNKTLAPTNFIAGKVRRLVLGAGIGGSAHNEEESTPATRTSRKAAQRLSFATVAAASLLGSLVVLPVPAVAALPGAAVRSMQTPFDAVSPKTAMAMCPEGTRVTGGGGRIDGFADHVVLTRMRPVHTNNLDRFEVSAAADETGTTQQWAVTAIVICASPITGTEIVSVTRPGGDTLQHYARATCPVGKTAIGGGGQITGGAGQVHLAYTGYPSSETTEAMRPSRTAWRIPPDSPGTGR